MITVPRIVIAGTHSGCGKTTVASGIMAALIARGLKVQPFKVGPDFIDPSHHTLICGRESRNLDPFMMGEDGCLETFTRASSGADVAVIEGVMGMFDGVDGSDNSSTAHVARILRSPVILVVDVKGMSRSVHALIRGYQQFDPMIDLAGIIFNRVGSHRHKEMITSSGTVRSFGYIPRSEDLSLPSRHLGLIMAHESSSLKSAGSFIEQHMDLDGIIVTAQSAHGLPECSKISLSPEPRVRIGIARDRAFCFYYQDNLDNLKEAGAELVFFSPLSEKLPPVDVVYLGGGYPELYLPALASSPCTQDLKHAADRGIPLYAECGGLMYLTREIQAEKTFRMAGVLPAESEMTGKIQALGYVKGSVISTSSFLQQNASITGHEFHYSRLVVDSDVRYSMKLLRGKGIESGNDGMTVGNALGSYTHCYFSHSIAADLVRAGRIFSER